MPSNATPAAKPTKSIFDPFNSTATGHQRADNRLSSSTSWRESRSFKLHEQFRGGAGGGKRLSDTVGAGSLDFGHDGRTENGGWVKGAKGLRTGGQKSIWESMNGAIEEREVERPTKRPKTAEEQKPTKVVNPWTPFRREDGMIRESSWTSHESSPSHLLSPLHVSSSAPPTSTIEEEQPVEEEPLREEPVPQIFSNLCFYINGSTAPLISDHRLKQLLNAHGGRTSIALGRRTVTHVIIGRPSSTGGSGGGLAGSKIQKEITRVGGNAVKFVTVEWAVESVKAGKRLPEGRFEALRLAPKGVNSVASIFGLARQAASGKPTNDDAG